MAEYKFQNADGPMSFLLEIWSNLLSNLVNFGLVVFNPPQIRFWVEFLPKQFIIDLLILCLELKVYLF